ncbi:MAG: hypothetical protein ACFFHD_05510 [Promethearchaeota archaeon]
MEKSLKKEMQIGIDEKTGQLYFGDKKKDIRLLMLRPIDLIEFSEFAGSNADDIVVWVGKSLGRAFMEKFFENKDWSSENMATRKEVLLGVLEAMEVMGYGHLTAIFKKNFILIEAVDSLASDEQDNIMAKNLCLLTQGILNGMFEILNIDVDSEEIECVLVNGQKCVYQFSLIGVVLEDSLVEEDTKE